MAKRPTYAKAKEVLLDALERAPGWEVTRWSRGRALKTPYAEHGWGRHACRMWFKSQSIYYQRNGPPFSLNAAHSIHTDPRMLAEVVISGKMTADALGAMLAERVCEEPEPNPKGPVRRGRASKATLIYPPPEASMIAASALERRMLLSPSRRGGLTKGQAGRQGITSGVERAESIARGDEQPAQDIDAFFNRFRGTYEDSLIKHSWERSKVQQSWDLWGGQPMWDAARRALGKVVDNPGCLPCMLMLANPSPPPKLEALDLAGRKVALAINLHRCRPGKPIPDGAACFSVREKPRSSSKVLGYVDRVVLKDVKFVVNERSLERIQNRGTREVCCFVVGTVMRPRAPELKGACACEWTPIHFNPFRSPCFTTPKGKCAVSARYAAMVDKAVAAEGVKAR
jgi:hypothetical protein